MNQVLTVAVHNDYTLKTIDVNTGAIKTVRQVGGKIIQEPIVTKNEVSCTVETPGGKFLKIFKLPNLLPVKTTAVT